MIGLIVLAVLFGFCLSIVYWTVKNGISPMPTSPKILKELRSFLPNHHCNVVYELGCGWGTCFKVLAQKYPSAKIIGIENSFVPFCVAWVRAALWRYHGKDVTVLFSDMFEVDLADASLVFCYLYPGAMVKLKGKFENELRPGSYVVSHTFAVPGWTPIAEKTVHDLYKTKIYLYCI